MKDLYTHLQQQVKKAIFDFGLITDGDSILIGLSGGKDSLALVELLSDRQRIQRPNFRLVAAHITISNIPYQSDIPYLEQFCNSHGVEFHHIATSFSPSGDEKKDNKTECFFCSWSRRKALFQAAKELNCNKIALGHHQDDIIETLLLNEIFQGSVSTMPPLLRMNKFDMTIIRPLCLIRESEVEQLKVLHNYHKQNKNCPFEKVSNRNRIKQLLKELESINPHAIQSLWNATMNIQSDYLPHKTK